MYAHCSSLHAIGQPARCPPDQSQRSPGEAGSRAANGTGGNRWIDVLWIPLTALSSPDKVTLWAELRLSLSGPVTNHQETTKKAIMSEKLGFKVGEYEAFIQPLCGGLTPFVVTK